MDKPESLSPFEPLLQMLPSMFGPPPQKEDHDDEYPIVTERRWFIFIPGSAQEDQLEQAGEGKEGREGHYQKLHGLGRSGVER